MKLRLKYSFHITATISLLLLGCGKKNLVNLPGGVNGNPPLSTSQLSQWEGLRGSIACLNGRNRLANNVSFYLNGGSINGTTIGGQWNPGTLPGTVSNIYYGVSAYRDILMVTKVTNGGGQVIGYNATLSFCEVPNAYPNYPALISNDRALINFNAPQGIVLDTNTYCGYGVVDAAINTVIISQRSTTNPYTSDFPVYTSFTKPLCNNQF